MNNISFEAKATIVHFSLLLVLLHAMVLLHAQPPGKQQPVNIIYILADDHRYDAMGFMNKVKGLETPGLDRMAREGAHIKNAFVSTALCSPSRASILTGQYAHTHTVVDNDAPLPSNLVFFPQYLKKKGYQTAFMGKWHMGNTDDQPQPGFDYWLSFQGQGVYYSPIFNINGKRVPQPEGSYTTDLLTQQALDWLNARNKSKPFFLYLSHKGVHAEFQPAKRHAGKYAKLPVVCPPSMYLTTTNSSKFFGVYTAPATKVNYRDIPQWVRRQRHSWHGVDYMYHGAIPFDDFYRLYLETLLAVDESVQKILDWVKEQGLEQNTVVAYMGDNGFSFGEHGLIDKRHAYEESMRVPLLFWAPGLIKPGTTLPQIIMNIDLAPTFLELAGIGKPQQMQGISFAGLLRGKSIPWRDKVFYEYYWEAPFPQTPTLFAIRTDKYKYIYYNGLWDINELFDLENDPYEMNNLIRDTTLLKTGQELKKQLFDWLLQAGGDKIPLKRPVNYRFDHPYNRTY